MTAKQCFEALLIETDKVGAPSLLLEEYNYYINKVLYLYINKRYNVYDVNLQTTDDLRVLKASAKLVPTLVPLDEDLTYGDFNELNLEGGFYEVTLPSDYLHLLNCICIYELQSNNKCYNKGNKVAFPATRLTADSYSLVINNYYLRPLPKRPYYYIHNANTLSTYPYNPIQYDSNGNIISGTDMVGIYGVTNKNNVDSPFSEGDYNSEANQGSNFSRTITIGDDSAISTVERATAYRYGNASPVRMEIRCGQDNSIYKLVKVKIDYIKTPQEIRLTQELIQLDSDTSLILEYPDYVCQEIINELAHVIMERNGDPRIQTHPAITQSIANPAQTQTQAAQA